MNFLTDGSKIIRFLGGGWFLVYLLASFLLVYYTGVLWCELKLASFLLMYYTGHLMMQTKVAVIWLMYYRTLYDSNSSWRHYCSYIIRGTQFGTCIYMKLTLVRGERGSGSTTKIAELEYDLCSRQWTTMNITWIFHNKYFTVRVINCKFWWWC